MAPHGPSTGGDSTGEARELVRGLRVAAQRALEQRLVEEDREVPEPPAPEPCARCRELAQQVESIERSRGWRFLQLLRGIVGRAW